MNSIDKAVKYMQDNIDMMLERKKKSEELEKIELKKMEEKKEEREKESRENEFMFELAKMQFKKAMTEFIEMDYLMNIAAPYDDVSTYGAYENLEKKYEDIQNKLKNIRMIIKHASEDEKLKERINFKYMHGTLVDMIEELNRIKFKKQSLKAFDNIVLHSK